MSPYECERLHPEGMTIYNPYFLPAKGQGPVTAPSAKWGHYTLEWVQALIRWFRPELLQDVEGIRLEINIVGRVEGETIPQRTLLCVVAPW